MIKIDFLTTIGFFDEYPFLYCEEAILAAQVKQFRKKMFYTAEICAIHRHIKQTKGNFIQKMREYRRSRIYFHKKYVKDNFFYYSIFYVLMHIWYFATITIKKIRA